MKDSKELKEWTSHNTTCEECRKWCEGFEHYQHMDCPPCEVGRALFEEIWVRWRNRQTRQS